MAKNLTMMTQMDYDKSYCTKRETTNVFVDGTFQCEDLTRIELEEIGEVPKLYKIMKELAR